MTKRIRGFTVVEAIIVLAVLLIICGVVAGIVFESGQRPVENAKANARQYAEELHLGEVVGISGSSGDSDHDGYVSLTMITRKTEPNGGPESSMMETTHHLECGYGFSFNNLRRVTGCRAAQPKIVNTPPR